MKTTILILSALILDSCSKTYVCEVTVETSEPYPQIVETSIEIEMTKEEKNQYEIDNTFENVFSWPEEYTETVTTKCN